LDCRPGETCWIVNYFDAEPGPDKRDYTCGPLTYDGHGGTDFAIRDLAVMKEGVAVLAAASGVVRSAQDGMRDVNVRQIGRESVVHRQCGNGVVIDHADGWTTHYCHLRRGSVSVRPGDKVSPGQGLGLVGLSGMTEFPHLDFTVGYEGRMVDPFVGLKDSTGCGLGVAHLWNADALATLTYLPVAIYNAGFATAPPKASDVRRGQLLKTTLPGDSAAIVFWVDIFGVPRGSTLDLRISAPDGRVMAKTWRSAEKSLARQFVYLGKKRGDESWPPGRYLGEAVIRYKDAGGQRRFHEVRAIEVR
jgi:hypothetical protein